MKRDCSSISPSARALLLVKAHTGLPFARQAAELMFGAGAIRGTDAARARHFELRARSIDDALDELAASLVLELAAGFSFRGLDRAARMDVDYLETDLPAIAELKTELVAQLAPAALAGRLRVQALDALDRDAFRATVASLPPGELAIVNEGLLMYLDFAEKAQLAANIHEALSVRGGAWITADIYVRSEQHLYREPGVERFLAEHRVEDKKFADWSEAEAFLTSHQFRIDRRYADSTDPWRVRETWLLRAG